MVQIFLLAHKKAGVPPWSWAALRFKIPPTSGAISALEWQCVEMRVSRLGMYPELLDDTVV
jgi:hypothetical protein